MVRDELRGAGQAERAEARDEPDERDELRGAGPAGRAVARDEPDERDELRDAGPGRTCCLPRMVVEGREGRGKGLGRFDALRSFIGRSGELSRLLALRVPLEMVLPSRENGDESAEKS